MLFIYKLHISHSQHLQKWWQRMVGWVTISHHYNFPLLHSYFVSGSVMLWGFTISRCLSEDYLSSFLNIWKQPFKGLPQKQIWCVWWENGENNNKKNKKREKLKDVASLTQVWGGREWKGPRIVLKSKSVLVCIYKKGKGGGRRQR